MRTGDPIAKESKFLMTKQSGILGKNSQKADENEQ